jgi:hypothetical protein
VKQQLERRTNLSEADVATVLVWNIFLIKLRHENYETAIRKFMDEVKLQGREKQGSFWKLTQLLSHFIFMTMYYNE